MIRCEYIFPTPVWSFNFECDQDKMIEYINELMDIDPGREVSNSGGWQSNDIDVDNTPQDVKNLVKFVEKNVPLFMSEYGYSSKELYLDNLWFNVNPKGGFNKPHVHGGCFLSGVYYIKTKKDCGDIVFSREGQDSYIIFHNVENPNGRCGHTDWRYIPEDNMCVLFPSWLSHRVEINNTDSDRISLAFNLSWK